MASGDRFDDFTRVIGSSMSRRKALTTLLLGGGAVLGSGLAFPRLATGKNIQCCDPEGQNVCCDFDVEPCCQGLEIVCCPPERCVNDGVIGCCPEGTVAFPPDNPTFCCAASNACEPDPGVFVCCPEGEICYVGGYPPSQMCAAP